MSPNTEESSCPVNTFGITQRTSFNRSGAQVFGWPSTGGVLVKEEVDGVELDFLGLDRFDAFVRSASPMEEDRFCKLQRRIGATWWSNEWEYVDTVIMGARREKKEAEEQRFVFGWPNDGGVWVLVVETEGKIPHDLGRIHLAFTMEERCQAMKGYGAEFFEKPEDREYLIDGFT